MKKIYYLISYDILILVIPMQFDIKDNHIRFIVISDLHLGNNKERLDLVYKAYEYALDKEIYTIINLGDLIDSVMPHNQKDIRLTTIDKQIRYVIENYPFHHNITTYALYGNHDYYSLLKYGVDIAQIISEERSDLINLGYGENYLCLEENYIKLSHPIRYLSHYKRNIETPINLLGHYHSYKVNLKDSLYVYAPSLSNLSTEQNLINKPEILDIDIMFFEGIMSRIGIKNIDIEKERLDGEFNIDLRISKKRHTKIKEYFKRN